VICNEDGRVRVTTDEERVLRIDMNSDQNRLYIAGCENFA